KDPPVRELGARLVGIVHCAFNAVAEAELVGELYSETTGFQPVAARTKEVHDVTGVVRVEDFLNLSLEAEALAKVRGVRRSAHAFKYGRPTWLLVPLPLACRNESSTNTAQKPPESAAARAVQGRGALCGRGNPHSPRRAHAASWLHHLPEPT